MSPSSSSGEGHPEDQPILKMPDVVICKVCGKPIEDIEEAVEMTPYGTDTRQFAHRPIPGCPTD